MVVGPLSADLECVMIFIQKFQSSFNIGKPYPSCIVISLFKRIGALENDPVSGLL